MKICFIADPDSIHTRRWIQYFCKPENEVHILSVKSNAKPMEGAIIHNLPTLRHLRQRGGPTEGISVTESASLPQSIPKQTIIDKIGHSIIGLLVARRVWESWLVWAAYPFYEATRVRNKAKTIIAELRPDIVHCIALPHGGYIGGLVGYRPLAMTTWGNDMVYFARKYFLCRWLTKKAMSKVDLYFSDSLRDKYIAEEYGFSPSSLTYITPVTGGLKLEELPLFHKEPSSIQAARQRLGISPDTNLILSTRGFKTFHVYTETLVKAIPKIRQVFRNTFFILIGDTQSSGYFQLKKMAQRLGVEEHVRFIGRLGTQEFTDYLTASDIMVSVTLCDGCPVSMLEGMAYGLIPVMSTHSPIQEWLTDGWNGYLFDPRDPENIAQAIVTALKNKDNFPMIRERNWNLLRERADYHKNMKVAEELYHKIINRKSTG